MWRPSAWRAPSPRRHHQASGFIEPGREEVALPRLVALRCPFICLCGQVGTLELGLCGHFCVCSASDLLSKLVLVSRFQCPS